MPAEGLSRVLSPTRVDLAGGTLDLWPLHCFFPDSMTVNLALDLFAEAAFERKPAPRFGVRWVSPQGASHAATGPVPLSECLTLDPGLRYPVAVVSRFLEGLESLPPTQLTVTWGARVPMGSGLGGSSALGVGLWRGAMAAFDFETTAGWEWALAAAIRDTEARFLHTPTGTQDYLAALFGGLSRFDFLPGRTTHFAYAQGVVEALADRLVVLFSGEQHHSGRSNWEIYKAAVEKDPKVLEGLSRIAETARQMDAALRARSIDWAAVGRLISQEWAARRECLGVSTPGLDAIVEKAAGLGALGIKVCGAAAGGSLLCIVEPGMRSAFTSALASQGVDVLPTQPSIRGVHLVESV